MNTIQFCLFLSLCVLISSKRIIWDENVATPRLQSRISLFNEWYSKLNPSCKVEARLTEDPDWTRVGLYAKENIKEDDVYMKLDRSMMISHKAIYDTKIGPILKELEAKFGQDDYINMVLFLLHEMNNPQSVWKPYLDLLPHQPTSITFKYWERKKFIEEELLHTPILTKIVDYKYLNEKKSRNYAEVFVTNHTDILDPEFYNEENFEWACLILDSRLIYVNYEAFLIPMLDLANFKENKESPHKLLKPVFTDDKKERTEIKAGMSAKKGEQIFENKGLNNEDLLIYHGIVLPDLDTDCYSLTLQFTRRQDDPLREKRKDYFAYFFLYDDNHMDTINECVSLRTPYSRRMLFYYYVLMMDDSDMQKIDPKRVGLESDRFVLENVKNELKSLMDLYPSSAAQDMTKMENEPSPAKSSPFIPY